MTELELELDLDLLTALALVLAINSDLRFWGEALASPARAR